MAWAESFQTGLRSLAGGQCELAERSLIRAHEEMRRESPNDMWDCLLANCLAVAAARRGDYAAGQEHYSRSRQLWDAGQFEPREASTSQALQWFETLLTGAGLGTEAGLVARRRQNGQVPLLDPFEEVAAPLASGTHSASEWLGGSSPSPPVGLPTAPRRPAPPAPRPAASWGEALTEGLTLAKQGRGPGAVERLDQALELARVQKDGGVRSSVTYNALAMALFLTGDYPGSDAAQAEALARWPASGPQDAGPLVEYGQALRSAGLESEASLLDERRAAGQSPLLSPWQDLSSAGITRGGGPAVSAFRPDQDWLPRLGSGLKDSARGRGREAVQQLSGLVEQLRPLATAQRLRLALARGAVSLAAYLQGDYALAETAYKEAIADWELLSGAERESPLVSEFVATLQESGLSQVHALVSPRVGSAQPPLLNPFVDKVTTSTMAVVETGESKDRAARLPPAEAYVAYMKEGLELAGKGRYEQAQRALLKAVEKGRLGGGPSIRACLAMDTLAVVCQRAGDYAGAEKAYADALSQYQVEEPTTRQPAVGAVFSDLVDWLGASGFRQESERLKDLLERSRQGATEPVLLCPWTDVAEPELRKDLPTGKIEILPGPARGRRRQASSKAGQWVLLLLVLAALGGGAALLLRPKPVEKIPSRVVFGFLEVSFKSRKTGSKVEFMLQLKNTGPQPVKAESGFQVQVRDAQHDIWSGSLSSKGPLTLAPKAQKVLSLGWDGYPLGRPLSAVAKYGSVKLATDL